MLQSIMSEVRVAFDVIPGEKGHYFYEPHTQPIIVINQDLPAHERNEVIIALYVESKLQLAMSGRELYPFELSFPSSLPTPRYRQWTENGKLAKLVPTNGFTRRILGD